MIRPTCCALFLALAQCNGAVQSTAVDASPDPCAPQVIVSDVGGGGALTSDGEFLFWDIAHNEVAPDGGIPPPIILWQTRLSTLETTQVSRSAASTPLVFDSNYLYYGTAELPNGDFDSAKISRVSHKVMPMGGFFAPTDNIVYQDADFLYGHESSHLGHGIGAINKGTGDHHWVVDDIGLYFALSGRDLFVTTFNGDEIVRVPVATGQKEHWATAPGTGFGAMAAADGVVFVIVGHEVGINPPVARDLSILAITSMDQATTFAPSTSFLSRGIPNPSCLGVSDGMVYHTVGDATLNVQPVSGGPVRPFASTGYCVEMTFDDKYVYWIAAPKRNLADPDTLDNTYKIYRACKAK